MKSRFYSSIVASATVIAVSAHAAPRTPEVLAPSSSWNVNYGDDSCRLARAFGTGEALTLVVFDQFAPGQAFKLTFGGKRFRNISTGGSAHVRFGPDEAEQQREYLTGNYTKDLPALILRGDLRMDNPPDRPRATVMQMALEPDPPIPAARVAAVKELTIGRPLGRPVILALGSMKAPMAALDKCMTEMQTRWGIDVARHATLSRRAAPAADPRNWLQSSDYPLTAMFRGAQGVVNFRLSIDEAGKATACHIQQSTRPPEFDKTVCAAMMRRARFTPALDKDGAPLASFYRGTVVFKM